jgi:hypothetical protein
MVVSMIRASRLLTLIALTSPQRTLGFSAASVRNTVSTTKTKDIPAETMDNNKKNLIMVVGSANQDLTSNSAILPTIGETVMGNDFATACGGKGANQAVAAASLGLAPVAMVCRVGDDIFGQNLLHNFRKLSHIFQSSTIARKKLIVIYFYFDRSVGCGIQ